MKMIISALMLAMLFANAYCRYMTFGGGAQDTVADGQVIKTLLRKTPTIIFCF